MLRRKFLKGVSAATLLIGMPEFSSAGLHLHGINGATLGFKAQVNPGDPNPGPMDRISWIDCAANHYVGLRGTLNRANVNDWFTLLSADGYPISIPDVGGTWSNQTNGYLTSNGKWTLDMERKLECLSGKHRRRCWSVRAFRQVAGHDDFDQH